MLWTPLCDLFDIEYPIIQAGMGAATSGGLAAAVSNAGALGSLGAFRRPTAEFLHELTVLRSQTNRSIALNHVIPALNEHTFNAALAAAPKVMSFALDEPGTYVARAKDAGALVMHQVTTVQQAEQAAEAGVDVIVAQGGEAGGYSAMVATMPLVPQVVRAVAPVPVVAAGGIFDGRGLAAALMLGAVGVNVGTRFLATSEAPFQEWKLPILEAQSEAAVKVNFVNDVLPVPGTVGYKTVMRSIETEWVRRRSEDRETVRANPHLVIEDMAADRGNLPVSGQSAGGIRSIISAGEVVRAMAQEAEHALRAARHLLR